MSNVPQHTALPRHQFLDVRLRQRAGRIMGEFLVFAQDAAEFIREEYYVRFKFLSAAAYFEERLGLQYRSVRRYLSILEGVERLPPADQGAALKALPEVGAHKAAVIAPALGREGVNWRDLLDKATKTPEPALQAHVTKLLGRDPKPAASGHGERVLRYFLAHLPEDRQEQAERVIRAAMEQVEPKTETPISVFLTMVDLLEADLRAQGIEP